MIEGKITKKITPIETPEKFRKLICSVMYNTFPRATAIFVTSNSLLTVAYFLFDKDIEEKDKNADERVKAESLSIRTSFAGILKVTNILTQLRIGRKGYRRYPAILKVSYYMSDL